jgi:hypothetical protein
VQPRRIRSRVARPGVVVGNPADLSVLVVVVDRAVARRLPGWSCRGGLVPTAPLGTHDLRFRSTRRPWAGENPCCVGAFRSG